MRQVLIIICIVIIALEHPWASDALPVALKQDNVMISGETDRTTLSRSDIYRQEADWEVKQGEYDSAAIKYGLILDRDKDNISIRLKRAEAYLKAKEYYKAIKDSNVVLEKAESTRKERMQATILKANAYYHIGDNKQAEKMYDSAINIDTTDSNGYKARGDWHAHQHQWSMAVADYTEAINKAHQKDVLATAYRARAKIYIQQKESKKALDDYIESIVKNPKDMEWYKEIVALFNGHAMHNESLMFLDVAETRQGITVGTLELRSKTLEALGNTEEAIEAREEIKRIEPSNADNHKELGLLRMKIKAYEEATKDFSNAIKNDNKNYYLYTLRANAYSHSNKKAEAEKDMETAALLIQWENEKKQ